MEVKMKLLWIEDFGSGVAGSKLAIDMFGDLIPKSIFDGEYNHDEEVWTELPRLFEKHTIHRIYICKSYLEWEKVYGDHNGDFDIIFIDINLESYKTPKSKLPIKYLNFDKKAGFYIYNQLIKDGFPEGNIVFFTAEGNTLKSFERMCGDMLTDKPKNAFEKKSTHYERLRKWITKKINSRYYILRRGIIEGCRFLKKELENTKTNDLEQRLLFYKTTSDVVFHDPEIYQKEASDYLTKLENFLPLKPLADKTDIYELFLKELAGKWGKSSGYFRREKELPQTTSRLEDNFYKTSQFLMKMLRNWTAHDKISFKVSESEVAYFFMLGMRSWIKLDISNLYEYEKIFSNVFNSLSPQEMNKIDSKIENHLDESFYELLSEFKRKPDFGSQDNYFLSLLKEYGEAPEKYEGNFYGILREEVRSRSLRLFYQSFWHGLFPLWIKSNYGNFQSVNFDIESIPPNSFLYLLGRLIFKYSFDKVDKDKTEEK
jgi:hypothetical protein